jgi:hypothetical protein
MRFERKLAQLSCIDSEDDTFRITTREDVKDLTDSIAYVGLINPPLFIEKNSVFTIVCGFRRVEAYRCLGRHDIEARVAGADIKKLECVRYAITDNASQRPLNLVETYRSIAMLAEFYNDIDVLAKEAALLGLPENPSLIKKIKRLAGLLLPVQNLMLSSTISLNVALEMSELEEDVQIGFAKLFEVLKLSMNKQREMITFFKEIALREDKSIPQLFNDHGFKKILYRHDLDRVQKTQKIRSYLKKWRFPALVKAEKDFETYVKELKLGDKVQFIPPNNFEGTTYTLNLYFNNLFELTDHWKTLNRMIENRVLKKILG